jgi:acetyl-CoA carboxylase carboxyltransferase component
MEELGGPKVHGRNGVSHLVTADADGAIAATRHLLGLLPQSISQPPQVTASVEPDGNDPGAIVPANQRKVYDVRDVAAAILDRGSFLELSPRWAPNIVTGIARLEGRSVGLIANQPRALGGVIDAAASEKAALFVESCNRFRLPLLVFVDTPGFMPGKRQEEQGVIRHGASLLRAFAGASVPKVTLILRKAFGGAAITMNSKELGADVVYAWPGAQVGVMAAREAVGIVHHRALKEEGGPSHDELADAYAAEHLTAPAAAASGWVDEVIDPDHSRDRLAWALRSMGGV